MKKFEVTWSGHVSITSDFLKAVFTNFTCSILEYFVPYINGFKSKCNFFNRTIANMQNHMKITEDVLRNHFISAIIGKSSISEHLQQLIALTIQYGGMAVTTPHLNTDTEYNVSRLLTKDIVDHIISRNTEYKPNKERISEIKNNIKKGRTEAQNTNLSRIRENMSKD